MARDQVWDEQGKLIKDVEVPDRVPTEPGSFEQISPRELLTAMSAVLGVMLTPLQVDEILNRLKR